MNVKRLAVAAVKTYARSQGVPISGKTKQPEIDARAIYAKLERIEKMVDMLVRLHRAAESGAGK